MGTPRVIGHYRVAGKLGHGGMGEVWRAVDTKLQREVAVKILPGRLARDPELLARFEREAKGPLPLETALNYTRQIADALEGLQGGGRLVRARKAPRLARPAAVLLGNRQAGSGARWEAFCGVRAA